VFNKNKHHFINGESMMKAVVFAGASQPLALEERNKPVAESGELVLKVKACGICGSDLHGISAADASPYRDGSGYGA
jgi:D-arabinose 1-dehydrogenase-like Zn-dependent alcohol dehydrogenase